MALTKIPGNLIETGAITAAALDNDSVTTAKILDSNITHAKLHTSMDLTGKTVLVANASTGDNDTTAANTAFVQQEIAALVDSSPSTLNTLNELAAALGDNENFATDVTASIATKLPLAGGTLTGALTSNSLIKTTADLEVASAQPRIILDRGDGAYTWNIYNGNGSGNFPNSTFNIANNGGDAVLTALDNGNVGIGTTSPTADLSVGSTSTSSGDVHLRTTKTAFSITPSNTDAGGILFDLGWVNGGQGPMQFGIGGAEKMTIASSGNVGIRTGNDSPPEMLTIGSTSDTNVRIQFLSSTTGGNTIHFGDGASADAYRGWINYTHSDDALAFAAGGSEVFRIAGGSVGIGLWTGSYKLNVNGETKTLGLYSQGTTNLGTNGHNGADKTVLAGYAVLAGNGVRYGNYGSLAFRSSSAYTAGARSFLITNGYDSNKFAIIQSTTHTTIPDIDGAGGGANNGEPRFVINNSGNIGIGYTSPNSKLTVANVGAGDGASIADFVGSDANQRLIVANFACGSDEDRVGLIWENQGVALWREWMDDDGHLRLKSSNPTHDFDGKRVVTETYNTGTSGSFLEQIRVHIGNVASYTGDIEGGSNKGGTQIWSFTIQGDNTWRKVLTNMHDMSFEMYTVVGDAGSRDQASYSVNMTSPAYGVSTFNQNYYHNGGWNTGSFEYRFVATPGNSGQYDLECRFSSYYSSTNNGSGYIHIRRLY